MKVLLLNGPPRSGKDAIGRILWNKVPGCVRMKFASPIIDFMFKNFGIRMEEVDKDAPHPNIPNNRTPRELAIAYSEKFCKPLFGQEYFGEEALVCVDRMAEIKQKTCIFTDSGFPHEARPVAAKYPTLQIRLSRPGTSFIHDSRCYWDLPNVGVIEFDNNVGTIQELSDKVSADILPEVLAWLSK